MRKPLLLLVLLLAPGAWAQRAAPAGGLAPAFRVEVGGGAATYGRMLEQYAGGGERELSAVTGAAVHGAVGVEVFGAVVRLGASYQPTEFEWRDDSGTGSETLSDDDVGDLSLTTLSAEVQRAFGPAGLPVRPFASGGLALGLWSFDSDGRVVDGGDTDGTLARLGATGSVGLEARLSERLALVLEASTATIGNPFDGEEALRTAEPDGPFTDPALTFEEPDRVTSTRLRAGLVVLL